MKSGYNKASPTQEGIIINQCLFTSSARILGACLKNNPPKSTNCDENYREFDRQKSILEHKEKAYLDPLAKNLDTKREEFNKAFDPFFAAIGTSASVTPIEKLSEESQRLKKEFIEETNHFLETKRKFESFRHEILSETIIKNPGYSSNSFTLDWQKRFPNKEINALLECDLNMSNKSLKSINQRISDNRTAQYISIPEMLNDQLRKSKM